MVRRAVDKVRVLDLVVVQLFLLDLEVDAQVLLLPAENRRKLEVFLGVVGRATSERGSSLHALQIFQADLVERF